MTVAGQVGSVEVTQIPSLSPTLNVSWSPPSSGGAAITSYTLHFTSSGEGRGAANHNGSVVTNGNASAAVIRELLADGRTYGVTVEARSLHFSSYSAPLPYTPCELAIHTASPLLRSPSFLALVLVDTAVHYTKSLKVCI